MASRNSFLDSPSFRRITPPSQRRAVESRRRSSGFRGGGSSSSPIRRETEAEKTQRLRQERLQSFQSELAPTENRAGIDLTASERQAILEGKPVSEIREQVNARLRKRGFASLQRDLSRSGTRLTPEEARLIAQGETSPSELRSQVESRRGREFARQGTTSFVTVGENNIPVSEEFASRVERDVESGRLSRAQESIRADRLERFANQSDELTVISTPSGPELVTTSGDFVGGVSLDERASFVDSDPRTRLVTRSGRDVTPRVSRDDIGGVVSASGRTPFASRSGVQRVLGGQFESQSIADFGGGVSSSLLTPGSSAVELFSIGERGRVAGVGGSSARFAGQAVGLAGSVGATGIAFRGIGFVAGVARPAAQRTLSRLGFSSAASRTAAGFGVAPFVGAGLLAPEVVSSTASVVSGTSSFGVEALQFGVNRAVEFGAGTAISRSGRLARSFTAGQRVSEGSRGFTRQGVLGGSDIDSVVADSIGFNRGFIDSDVVSVRSGSVPTRTSFRSGAGDRQFLSQFDFSRSAQTTGVVGADNTLQTTFSLSQPEEALSIAEIFSDSGQLLGASRVRRNIPSAGGFTTDAALLSAASETPTLNIDNDLFSARFVGRRSSSSPRTLSQSQFRNELARLEAFSSGDLVEGSRLVGRSRVRVSPDQQGLSSFGDLSFNQARNRLDINRLRGSLRSPTSNLLFADPTGGLATGLLTRRSTGRLSSQPSRSTRLGASPSRARGAVRSRSSQGFFTGFIPRINTGLASSLSSAQTSSLASSNRLSNLFDVGTGIDSGFRIRSGQRASQGLGVDEALRQDQITTQISIPRIGIPTRPGRPGRPRTPPPPRRPRVPDFDLPQLNFGLSGRQRQRGRRQRREEFTPSVIANFLGITGERSRVSTGIEIRPIIL